MAAQGFLLLASFLLFLFVLAKPLGSGWQDLLPPFRYRAWLALSVSSGGLLALPTTK